MSDFCYTLEILTFICKQYNSILLYMQNPTYSSTFLIYFKFIITIIILLFTCYLLFLIFVLYYIPHID